MTPFARILCAISASAILAVVLQASRTGRFGTLQGTLYRRNSPRLFRFLIIFWFLACVFLFAAAVGVFGPARA